MSDSPYLLTLYGGSTSSSADSLINIIYNGGTTTPGTGTAYGITSDNPVVALKQAETTQSAGIAYEAKQPTIEQTLARFTAAVKSAKSVKQLLSNPAVLTVLLTANNLASQVSFTALAQKALTSDPSDPNSLVNKLTDTDWKSAAETYQFATQGLSVIQSPSTLSTLTSAYTEVMWRQSLDHAVPGLSNALSFKQEASGITSVDQILGDFTLRTVVTTALGIPEQIAFQPLEAQEKAISSRLDISKFKDPTFVNTFAQQYLLALNNNGGSGTTGLVV
jgi:hypothetical protein